MPWPLPTPAEIADRIAGGYEAELQPLLPPGEVVDARSERSPLAVAARVHGLAMYEGHLHVQQVAQELWPDSAEADLARHGSIWGVPRRLAAAASGSVTFSGSPGLALPAGMQMRQAGLLITTTAAGVIGAGGTGTVLAGVDAPGTAGNLPAGTPLPLVSPLAGLSTQAGTVAAPGFSGGEEDEALEDWRARILARIRSGVPYGQRGAYEAWALGVAGVVQARELPGWLGLGSVGVAVATGTRRAPAVPTAGELAAVQAALDAARPVTALVVALPVVLQPVPLSLRLSPDTVAVRAAVTEAFAAFLAAEPGIGGTVERSRLSEALSSAAGEYAHRLDVPAASIPLGPTALAVPGAITWLPS